MAINRVWHNPTNIVDNKHYHIFDDCPIMSINRTDYILISTTDAKRNRHLALCDSCKTKMAIKPFDKDEILLCSAKTQEALVEYCKRKRRNYALCANIAADMCLELGRANPIEKLIMAQCIENIRIKEVAQSGS